MGSAGSSPPAPAQQQGSTCTHGHGPWALRCLILDRPSSALSPFPASHLPHFLHRTREGGRWNEGKLQASTH